MASEFKDAFVWHLERHNASLAEIVRETGVSLDVLKKLKSRPTGSTTVENGILIAAYFGKTVTQFINREEPTDATRLAALLELLPSRERQLLEAQIRGILRAELDQ